jgi:hypothetical protein
VNVNEATWPEPQSAGAMIRLEMALVDDDGRVLASASEPFELGRFDIAAARQGMRKMLVGMGGIGDEDPEHPHCTPDLASSGGPSSAPHRARD